MTPLSTVSVGTAVTEKKTISQAIFFRNNPVNFDAMSTDFWKVQIRTKMTLEWNTDNFNPLTPVFRLDTRLARSIILGTVSYLH
jgi:hypothetical protein